MIECVLEGKKWPKSIPKITDKAVAIIVSNLLIQSSFIHRSEKVDGKKGVLKVSFIHFTLASIVFKIHASTNKLFMLIDFRNFLCLISCNRDIYCLNCIFTITPLLITTITPLIFINPFIQHITLDISS